MSPNPSLIFAVVALGAAIGAAVALALDAPGLALGLLAAGLIAGAAFLAVRRAGRAGAEATAGQAAFVADLPIGIASIGRAGAIAAANAAFAAALGRTPSDLAGARLADIAAPGADPDGAVPAPGSVLRLRRADGRALSARVVGSAVGDAAAYGLALVPDGEATQRLEGALVAAERRFQAVFDDAPIAMARLDEGGAIVEANPALIRMAGGGDLADRPLISLARAQDRAALERALKSAFAGAPAAEPIEIRLAAPGERPVETIAVAASGGGAMVFLSDSSQRAALSVQLAQSQKMQAIGQLAGGVAHDFNNLLTAIIGFCDLLLQRHRAGDQSFADVMQIKQNSNRAAGLVRQLLAFSRQQRLEPRVIVITDTLAELTHLLRRLIGQGIELNVVHGRDLWPARVDQGQLEQVVINLAVNARDAMPSGGTLTVATDNLDISEPVRRGDALMPAGSYVRLQVIDTGTGIPPDIVERIFEPFFSTKAIGSGTGLGLSTVYGIVKQTGGFIFVDSVPGQGSTFNIYLPRHMGPVAADAEAAERRGGSDDVTGAGTILLVEDEDAVRLFGARALRGKGYKVIEAREGDAALDLMGEGQQIDLLISDMMMPGMDGPTLIGHARRRRPDLPVVCISGYAEEAMRAQLAQHKNIAFLAKPFSLKQLAMAVKDALARERVG